MYKAFVRIAKNSGDISHVGFTKITATERATDLANELKTELDVEVRFSS